MKTLIKLLVLATAVISIYAQGYKAPTLQGNAPSAQYLLNNGSQGKEFIFCLPLNDCMPCPTTARNIYITSSKNTTFTYEIVGTGFKRVFQVKAFKVTTLDQNDVPIPEIELSETNSDDVIRITSKDNLSVYVYNGKQVSSDGYLAIPVRSWGKSYMNLGYPDFSEVRPWRAGFAIVAAENATNVTITLRSKNYGVCAASGVNNTTEGGKKYGQSWKISLNKGQAYLVQGDGKTRGLFDLSGSTVTSDKPIGFITYTRRTMIPYGTNPGGRDHTCEMVPPTDKWGKNYVTVEVLRGGKGDLYRAVPLYDGTTIAVKCYDFKDQRLLQTALKPNLRSGEAVEMPVEPAITNGQGPGYKGMCVWSANKPFFLMHLNASTAWDNAPNNDPFMIYCVPTEQFTTATIFQSPDNPVYKEHYFNLIAIGDTNDPSYAKLRTIKLDDKYIFNITPSFLGNHIPGTNFWYTRIPVANGPHVITGDAPFGGDIYGYGSFDSYGWPAATAYRNLAIWDTLPPVPTRSEDCGDYTYKVTETRNFKINDTLDQVETGVVDIDFLDDPRNSNYEFEFLTSDGKIINDNELPDEEKNAIVEFRLKVIDKSKDAFAIFHMTDRALNRTIDSVSWSAPKLKVQPDPVLFGNVRVGKSKTLDVTVTNPTDSTLTVTEIRMKSGQVFSVQSDSIPKTGLLIPPHGTITLKVTYKPDKEGETDLNFDFDSVLIKDKCAPFRIYVKGR
ncbi:MAG: hypothetical protein JNJ85_08430, partial [Candidatus Kapabacteria bacterium]|nr:hypothetical protein [Candidatus Kapabacteria bacterium]